MPTGAGVDEQEGSRRHLGVRLEKDLHQALKIQAVREERSLSELVRDAVQTYLEATSERRSA